MDRFAIESIFDTFDQGGKGYLDKSELSQLYQQSPIPGCEIDQLFTIIDTNSDGKIEKEEFVNSFVEVIGKFQRSDDDEDKARDDESMVVDEAGTAPLFSGSGVATSTPKRHLYKDSPGDNSSARFASKASWEDFTSSVGDTVYTLFSYERIQAFYQKIANANEQPNDVLLDGFESMMRSMVKEFYGMQGEISQLKDSLEKEQEKTDNQISVLAEEMDAQIAAKEKSAREEERRASEDRIRSERNQYERRIEELTEAVSKLKKIDEKLSTSSPLQNENERLRERVRHIMEENSALSFNLNERDTRILVLESQISTLNVELQEKHIEVQRENETAEYALRERDNMSRQLTSICSDNRKLRDFNDEVRQSITNSNSARLHHQRAAMTSYSTASPLSNVSDGGKGIVVVENDDYFVCDPQFTHSRQNSGPAVGISGAASYDDEGDDVTIGTDISSLMETTASRASAASAVASAKNHLRQNQRPKGRRRRQNYDLDSGVSTLRNDDVDDADDDDEEEDDEEEMRSERTEHSRASSRRKTPAEYASSPVPPKLRFPRSPQRCRRVQSASPAPHRASPHPPPSQTSSTGEQRRYLNTPPESRRSSSLRRRHHHRHDLRRSSNASLNNFYSPPLPSSSASRPDDFTSEEEEEEASDITLPSRCDSRNEMMSTPSTYDNGSMSGRKKVIPGYIDEYDIQPHITAKTRLFKIILCGDANTGKSSFSLRFCKDEFLPKTRSTLGVDFRLRTIHVEHNRPVTLQIWDTAGQERFRSLSINYFRRADGVVLMYDVSNTQSFLNVREWMESIVDSVPPGTPVLLCANKTDLRTRLQQEQKEFVTSSEGAQLASSYGVFFIETSAATGGNVHHAMLSLARHLKDKTDEERNDIKRLTVVAKPQQSCCNRN